MALIEWRDDFRIGIASVDHEHRALVDLINDLHAKLGDKVDTATVIEVLGEIFARISAHFALEEAIMRERGYDDFDAHKADHEELLDGLRDIMDAVEEEPYPDLEATLSERLERWFTVHFRTHDARLHRFLN